MAGVVLLTVVAYGGMAAVDLPGLWKQGERRAFWTVLALLLLGLILALMVALGYPLPSVWKGIEALFKPIGTLLFKPQGR